MSMKNAFGLIGIILGLVLIASLGFGVIFTSGCGSTSSSTSTSSVEAGSPTATTETLAIARLISNQTITQIDLMDRNGNGQRELIKMVAIDGTSAGQPRGLAWFKNKFLFVSASNQFFDPWAVTPTGFYQIAIDKSDPLSKSIASSRPASYSTGTMIIDVSIDGVPNNGSSVSFVSRGAAAVGSTTSSSLTLTSVPVFADGANWIYAYSGNKYSWAVVPFSGGTVNVSINLSAISMSPGNVAINNDYEVRSIGDVKPVYTTTISNTAEGKVFSTLDQALNISPNANVIYYAVTNTGNNLTKIKSYNIATGVTDDIYDTLNLGNAIIPVSFYQLDFSADGTKLYYVAIPYGTSTQFLCQIELATKTATALYAQSTSTGTIADLALDPKGTYVYFVNGTTNNLYRVSADPNNPTTADQAERLTTSGDVSFVTATTL